MTRVAVVGAGAVGATLGAWLIADPRLDVTFCTRTPFSRLRVEAPGIVLEGHPPVFTDPQAATPVDWVLVATKTYDTEGTARWLDQLVTDRTRVAVLQNGVEHMGRFPSLAPARIVPVIVDIPAERSGPGQVRQRRNGSMLVPATRSGADFVRLFDRSPIEVQATSDWKSAAWRKLAINCAGAVNALTLKPADIANDPEVAEVIRGLVRECVAVGNAEGANLSPTLPDEVVDHHRQSPADSVNSIHADRLAGRPTEADARNGVIARLGARHGIDTPFNRMADILLRAS